MTRPDADGRAVRLAILDDHELLLDTMSSWIRVNAPDFDLALSAGTWLELVHSDNFPTDLVLIDYQLTEPISIEARVRTCRAAGAKVVVMSGVDTAEAKQRAIDAGAAAFLAKSLPMVELMDAARAVMGMKPGAHEVQDWRPLPKGAASLPRPKLSAGETQALRLYVTGHSTLQVAHQMNVQYETAKTYIRRVREKYAKVNRPAGKKAELIRRAAEDGYLQ
jgi:DNA-binding NarL/FixJ family response regulator